MQFSEDEIFALIGRLYAENAKLHSVLQQLTEPEEESTKEQNDTDSSA